MATITYPTRVRDIMQKQVITVPANMPIDKAAHLLLEQRISGAPVIHPDGEMVGVISLVDIVSALPELRAMVVRPADHPYYANLSTYEDLDELEVQTNRKVEDIMTPVVFRVHENDLIEDVVDLMLEAKIHRVLVTSAQGMVGIVTTLDLVSLLPDLLRLRER